MRWVLFLDVNSLLLLSQHIVLSHSAFWLSTERVGHDETVGILHLEVSSLAAGWADDFYYVVSQYPTNNIFLLLKAQKNEDRKSTRLNSSH